MCIYNLHDEFKQKFLQYSLQMYSKSRKPNASPPSPSGTSYFNHFPSNFLKPYGQSSSAPDHVTLMKHINPKSYEWLERPKVAMSEFASTIVDNMNWLSSLQNPVLNTVHMEESKEKLQPFLDALLNLNTRNIHANPNSGHIRTVLETFYDPSLAVHSLMKDFYEIGGAMYIMGIHYMMAMDLMSHPAEYADKMVGIDEATTAFKRDWNVRGLSKFLNSTCANSLQSPHSTRSVTRNLLDELRCTYETPTTTQQMSTSKQSLQTDSTTEDSSDSNTTSSNSSTSEQLQTNIRTKKNRKLPKRSDDQITFTTSTHKKKCKLTKQCHSDTVCDMPLTDTTLNKKQKRCKDLTTEVPDIPENQVTMQEHRNKKKTSKKLKALESESVVASKPEQNSKKSQKKSSKKTKAIP